MKKIIFISVLVCIILFDVSAQYRKSNNIFEKILLLESYNKTGDAIIHGSGFIIQKNNFYYLITAGHVTNELQQNSAKISVLNRSTVYNYSLMKLIENPGKDIKYESSIDMCIIKLSISDPHCLYILTQASFSESILKITSKNLKSIKERKPELISFGFPEYNLKTFSPISIRSHLASRSCLLNDPTIFSSECQVYYLDTPHMQGISGGPVFMKITNMARFNSKKIKLIGIAVATKPDQTGGKLGIVTNSLYINELLKLFNE